MLLQASGALSCLPACGGTHARQPSRGQTTTLHTNAHAHAQVRLKGMGAATNYSMADYCYNLAENYHATQVTAGVCRG